MIRPSLFPCFFLGRASERFPFPKTISTPFLPCNPPSNWRGSLLFPGRRSFFLVSPPDLRCFVETPRAYTLSPGRSVSFPLDPPAIFAATFFFVGGQRPLLSFTWSFFNKTAHTPFLGDFPGVSFAFSRSRRRTFSPPPPPAG